MKGRDCDENDAERRTLRTITLPLIPTPVLTHSPDSMAVTLSPRLKSWPIPFPCRLSPRPSGDCLTTGTGERPPEIPLLPYPRTSYMAKT